MAVRTSDKTRRPKRGDNVVDEKNEATDTNSALDELIAINKARDDFNAKMRKRSDKAMSILRGLGHAAGDVREYVKILTVERGKDDDAEDKAKQKMARRLDTIRRLHAATHNGDQLDWIEMQNVAEEARKNADQADDTGDGDEE